MANCEYENFDSEQDLDGNSPYAEKHCDFTHKRGQKISFSDSRSLKTSFEALLVTVSKSKRWEFNITDISYDRKRPELTDALCCLETYVKALFDLPIAPKSDEKKIITKLGLYVLNLLLEAEWISLSKGISSSCVSFLGILPKDILSTAVSEYIEKNVRATTASIDRKISDIYSLLSCDIILPVINYHEIHIIVDILLSLGIDSIEIVPSNKGFDFYKVIILVLKAFNIFLYSCPHTKCKGVLPDLLIKGFEDVFLILFKLLCDAECDKDLLSHAGISLVGIIYNVSSFSSLDLDIKSLFLKFLKFPFQISISFGTNERSKLFTLEDLPVPVSFGFFREENLIFLLESLPCLGYLYVARGVLTYLKSLYIGNLASLRDAQIKNKNALKKISPENIKFEDFTFIVDVLNLTSRVFKRVIEGSVKVNINFASLQGIQQLISLIRVEMFASDEFNACLTELPALIQKFWHSRVRRLSHLSICIWKKLLEVCCLLQRAADLPNLDNYVDLLIEKSTGYFAGNLKLKYIVLSNLLRYFGPSEILKREPFIIPHLLYSLTNPAIKRSSATLLAELLSSIYNTFRTYHKSYHPKDVNDTDIVRIALNCMVYPTIIAILHRKQVVVEEFLGENLIPESSKSMEVLESSACEVARSFKDIFGGICRNCAFELLKLSTCFTKCDFYYYLQEGEKKMLETPSERFIPTKHCDLREYFLSTAYKILFKRKNNDTNGINGVIHLVGPYSFPESMCLYNSRMLNRVGFIDSVMDGNTSLRGILIYDSLSSNEIDPVRLEICSGMQIFYISIERLCQGLAHINDEISLNIFRAVTCLPKKTQPIDVVEMHLVFYALKNCIKTSVPYFRQTFVSSLKPFIKRLSTVLMSNSKNECFSEKSAKLEDIDNFEIYILCPESKIDVKTYDNVQRITLLHCAFLRIILKCLVSYINPCASELKGMLALEILLIIYQVFGSCEPSLPFKLGLYESKIVNTLFYGLFYLSKKQQELLFQILTKVPAEILCFSVKKPAKPMTDSDYYLKTAISRALVSLWSFKTPEYYSGSKILTLLLCSTLFNSPIDNSESNIFQKTLVTAISGANILNETSTTEEAVLFFLNFLLRQLNDFCYTIEDELTPRNVSVMVSPLGLLSLTSNYLDSVPSSIYSNLVNTKVFNTLFNTFFADIRRISEHILGITGVALVEVGDNRQADDRFLTDCRGHLILKNLTCDSKISPKICEFKIDCKQCPESLVSHIMRNSYVPKYNDTYDSRLRSFTLLYWKTIRESCMLLKSLLRWILSQSFEGEVAPHKVFPSSSGNIEEAVPLYYGTVKEIGEYLIISLVCFRHLGCIDSFAEVLTWLCKKLVSLSSHRLLNEWLEMLLYMLKGNYERDKSRIGCFSVPKELHSQSESIALSFISILKAGSSRRESSLFNVINTLLEFSDDEKFSSMKFGCDVLPIDARINSLRILSAIFRCSELRCSNYIYVSTALCTSLKNMFHGSWSVRNAALSLFASVVQNFIRNDRNDLVDEFIGEKKLLLREKIFSRTRINFILDILKLYTGELHEECDSIPIIPKCTHSYQCLALILNLLMKIPLCSFKGDSFDILLSSVEHMLISSSFHIRSMTAKILAKNYFEASHTNTLRNLKYICLKLCNNMSDSNAVNGYLLLITEYMNIVASDSVGYLLLEILDYKGNKFDLYEKISSVCSVVGTNEVDNLCCIFEEDITENILLCALYSVCIASSCCENLIQTLLVMERLCLVYTNAVSFEQGLSKLDKMEENYKNHAIQCSVLLSLISSNILGYSLYDYTLSILDDELKSQMSNISFQNKNMDKICSLYRRLDRDPMVRIKAASSFLNSMLFVCYVPGNCRDNVSAPHGYLSGTFLDACSFLLNYIIKANCHKRVLECVMKTINKFVADEKTIYIMPDTPLYMLWEDVVGMISTTSPLFLNISALKLLNSIGTKLLKNCCDTSKIFDSKWARAVYSIFCGQILNNFELLSEMLKCCHIFSLSPQRLDVVVEEGSIFKIGVSLLLSVLYSASDIVFRSNLARLFREVGIPLPLAINDETESSKYEEYNTYCLHVFSCLLILLQDDSNTVRNDAAVCCSDTILKVEPHEDFNFHPNMCVQRLLSFALKNFSVAWAIRLFNQFTLAERNVCNTINYKLEVFGRKILDIDGKIPLTISGINLKIATSDEIANLSILAEVDTIFDEEPQNVYGEPSLYLISIDRTLCEEIRQHAHNQLKAQDLANLTAIQGFTTNSSIEIMEILKVHLIQNYQVQILDLLGSGAFLISITSDPIVVLCCVIGFSRCSISRLISELIRGAQRKRDDGYREKTWDMLSTFYNMLRGMNQLWSEQAKNIRHELEKLEKLEHSAVFTQVAPALIRLELLLNQF